MKPQVETLAEKYQNNLYAAAFNVCGNAHDAEDVVQDTFIQYILSKKDFQSELHIRAWLFRVAFNNVLVKIKTMQKGPKKVSTPST